MEANSPREILIVAGPNGAGKTTFARRWLAENASDWPFVNADIIAAELNPDDVDAVAVEAGRQMLREIDRLVAAGKPFCMETTLAGRAWAKRIREWQAAGYWVMMIFLSVPDSSWSKRRVAKRVLEGGHNIPTKVIERRFDAGLENLRNLYADLVNDWYLMDNSNGDDPILLEQKDHAET